MKTSIRVRTVTAVLVLATIPVIAVAQPRVGIRLGFGTPGNGFYISLSEDYGVPYQDIWVMHEAGVFDEDLPVILYLYTHSHYSLRQIYSLRLRGATWENLSHWCGVPSAGYRSGPPYGHAYGHYSHGAGKHRNGAAPWNGEGNGRHGKRVNGERGRGRF
jgi:hypothetical protein